MRITGGRPPEAAPIYAALCSRAGLGPRSVATSGGRLVRPARAGEVLLAGSLGMAGVGDFALYGQLA